MKKAFKYFLFLLLLTVAVFTDSRKNYFPVSLLLCVCFLLYKKSNSTLIICAFAGLFRDFLYFSLPYFSLTYLYISVGCVWCREMFLGLNKKKIALITSFAYLLYHILCYLINAVSFAHVFIEFKDIVYVLLSSALAGVLSPLIFNFFKRLRF